MHEEGAPTGYVCMVVSFMFHGGNVTRIAGGMSWHSCCSIADFDVSGYEFLVVFLDSGFIAE